MRKKLLAGVMALALCSTNMLPQAIFAGEFTSGNLEEVTEETPEIFSDDNQEVIEETEEELSVFNSENVPEFSSEVNIMSATADGTEPINEININDTTSSNLYDKNEHKWKITSAGSYKFNGTGATISIPIIIESITSGTVNIYLNNVNIETASGPALQITSTVQAQVCIYLENENNLITTNVNSAGLQKDNIANLTIDNSSGTPGILTAQNSAPYACGAGIGGGVNGSCSNITISGGSINASSSGGAGIGGGGMGVNGSCSNITINGGSVNASSSGGAGIGSGLGSGPEMVSSSCSNITISDGSVNASSYYGAGIGSGDATNRTGSCSNITISGGSVNASSSRGAGIGSGFCDMGNRGLCSNITISGGSVNAKIDCIPHQNLDSSGNYDPNSPNVYLCTIPNEGNDPITIDNTHWSPYSHIAVDSSEKKLYAWLTGEDHIVTVGTERRSYIFNSNSNEFNNTKRTVTSAIFEFNGSEFIYDGNTHSPNITTKNNIKGVGDFTVKYFKENDPTTEITEPKDVGTYIVKIDVNKGDFYNASSGYLTNDDWKFDIKPGTLTPTITNYTGEYDGKSHPIIKIDKDTIPKNSTIEYSVDNGQTWTTLNPNNDIPTVSTVKKAENTKICIRISNSNYTTWTSQEYKAIISRATQTPNYPSPSNTQISVPWSCKKVNEIAPSPLPANWEWQGSDKTKDLNVGDNTATAIYTGEDKGNYVSETVTYTIIRSKCEHKHTAERYYSSPSCTFSGYSGDTYCTDCDKTISYGHIIPAYEHDYDNGVITTEPTVETDGIITYTCKRCQHQDTKTLGKQNFIFTEPSNLTYDGTEKTASLQCDIQNIGNITLSYYKNGDNNPQTNGAVDVGTYTVKANIAGKSFTADKSWTFTIKPATFDEDSIKITAYNGTYDGDEHPIITGIFPTGSNVEYSTESPNESTIWSSTCPNIKTVADAKKTNVWIKISKDNYATKIYGPIQATINPASEAPGYPSTAKISVPWSCKKVNEIAANLLPANWKWQTEDAAKDLQIGNNSAAAIYTGEDKGNYVSETITYTIIRSKCEHKHTAERYYSSPSCTSSGYSGDTYCKDCNETISYGYTISAYGHDYDSGVITTEPTTETDGIITYTCKRCKHQDTKTLGKLGDGEPYIEGSFQKKGWDAVNDLIKTSKEKDTISITLNGSRTLPASVLSGIRGKDISLNLDMENGFIWKINGTSITAETPADTDLSVTNTAEYIPAALYSLISTNQNDFGFHLGRSGAFDFPAVLSVKADASCAGLMANLFWYDAENGVLQCIQTVTVGGAFERSIPYADFTLSKGQDYFIAFGTESLNGRVIHTDGSITDENGAYLRPANTKISSHSIDRNKLTVKLSKGCAGAQGYDFVISKKSNMLQTGKFSKKVSSTGKPQASFRYLAKGTWYVAARSWVLDAQGNKVYGSWTKIKKIKITVVTPQQPKIKDITVKENTVTVTYTKCKNATGYEILLGNKYKTSAGEKYPVKKYVKRTEGKNTVTVTFTNVKKGIWYVTVRSWNKTSKNKSRVYSPYSDIKKFKVKK